MTIQEYIKKEEMEIMIGWYSMLKKHIYLLTVLFLAMSCSNNISITVFENVTIIGGNSETPQPEMTILIKGDRIQTIGKSGSVTYPKSARVFNGEDKFVIPGLWDMHVHLYNTEKTIPLFVINGVTGVRDMGSELPKTKSLRQKILEGTLVGPRIKTSGSMIESRDWLNRYVNLMKQMGASETNIHNFLKNRITTESVEESISLVNTLASQGVDFLKIRHAPSKEAFFALAHAAKQKNLKLVGHYIWIVSLEEASDAGQASIEHNIFPGFNNRTPDDKQRLFKTMIENHTHCVPTLVAGEKEKTQENELSRIIDDVQGAMNDRNWYVEKPIRDEWREVHDIDKRDEERPPLSVIQQMIDDSNLFLRQAYEAGVLFMAGTDAPVTSVYSGFSLHDELQLLVRILGMTPMEAIQSATIIPAKFLELDNDLGSIEEGKLADFLILNENPLLDIANTQKIEIVIMNGRIYDQSKRARLLAEMKEAIKDDYRIK